VCEGGDDDRGGRGHRTGSEEGNVTGSCCLNATHCLVCLSTMSV
jgi:hypothetical protein